MWECEMAQEPTAPTADSRDGDDMTDEEISAMHLAFVTVTIRVPVLLVLVRPCS
jgi:hypothetical protein